MPQFARPDADITDGAWTKSSGGAGDMYTMIDEAIADDADYVQSEAAPASSAFAVGLGNVEDPVSSTGHIVRYRYQKEAAGGAQIDLIVQLRQGYSGEGAQGSLIHAETHTNIPNGWTAGTFTLAGAEADAITDYADLQLRLVANQV